MRVATFRPIVWGCLLAGLFSGCQQGWTITCHGQTRVFEARAGSRLTISVGDDRPEHLTVRVDDVGRRHIAFAIRRYRDDEPTGPFWKDLYDRLTGRDAVLLSRDNVRIPYDSSRQISSNLKIEAWIESARDLPKFMIRSISRTNSPLIVSGS